MRGWEARGIGPKGLSPEIIIVSEADTVHLGAGNSPIAANRQGCRNPTGSKTAARYQKGLRGTWEIQNVPNSRVCITKPINGKAVQMTFWESYQPILSKKLWKQGGEKELAAVSWGGRDTSSALRDGVRKSTKLSSLSVRAGENPRLKFTSLAHFITVDFLERAFRELKKDRAPGVDGVTVKDYEADLEGNLKDLVQKLKTRRYRPQPVRRVYIPKPKGGRRPLGVPTVEDKVVQMALKKILEAIFEVDFLDVSFGFRPNRNCHQALDRLDKAVMRRPVNYIVDMDIERFFDTVNHKWLMRFLRKRIADPEYLETKWDAS